jgi:hypothetical protein
MRLLLFLFATLTIVYKSPATTVVAIVVPDRVVLAADGKMIIMYGASTLSQTVNKIKQANQFCFACSGFFKNPEKKFDAIEITQRFLTKDGRLDLKDIEEYKAQIIVSYEAILSKTPSTSPLLRDDVGLFQCIIVGLTPNGDPFARALTFFIKDKKAVEKKIDVTDDEVLASESSWARPFMFCIGSCQSIVDYRNMRGGRQATFISVSNFLLNLKLKAIHRGLGRQLPYWR